MEKKARPKGLIGKVSAGWVSKIYFRDIVPDGIDSVTISARKDNALHAVK